MPRAPFFLGVFSLLVLSGCGKERASLEVDPDRQAHERSDAVRVYDYAPKIGSNQIWIVAGPGDTLTSIAKKYGTTIEWLIRRNDLTGNLLPNGTNLIVPSRYYIPSLNGTHDG